MKSRIIKDYLAYLWLSFFHCSCDRLPTCRAVVVVTGAEAVTVSISAEGCGGCSLVTSDGICTVIVHTC